MKPVESTAWQHLAQAANGLSTSVADLIDSTPPNQDRITQLQHKLAGVYFDFSKQRVNQTTLGLLEKLAQEVELDERIRALFAGAPVNVTEASPALHTALRASTFSDPNLRDQVEPTRQRMFDFAAALHDGRWRGYTNKPITDVVHIGIGGSHLGPELAVNALSGYRVNGLRFHFVVNIDAHDLFSTLRTLDPSRTLFIVVSKSWNTLETRINANSARQWFLERTANPEGIAKHFVAVSANVPAALEFGLDEANVFPIWDWVGGRYSLWSAVGLPILLSIGETHFKQFLSGAEAVDQHFASATTLENIPAVSALLATWNYNFLGATSLAILAYDERLAMLPEYLQQLEMESNGKSVDVDGVPIDYHTMPVLWGGVGTRGQHAYHQLLHQGTRSFAADVIVVAKDDQNNEEHHNWLLANALGQSKAFAVGEATDEAHRAVAGNHATTTIVLDELGPEQLGALLATYEHKVFVQGAIWNINPFDQWGVELGKKLAVPIFEQLTSTDADPSTQDLSTNHLIDYLRKARLRNEP